jgi:hypothetical protein
MPVSCARPANALPLAAMSAAAEIKVNAVFMSAPRDMCRLRGRKTKTVTALIACARL